MSSIRRSQLTASNRSDDYLPGSVRQTGRNSRACEPSIVSKNSRRVTHSEERPDSRTNFARPRCMNTKFVGQTTPRRFPGRPHLTGAGGLGARPFGSSNPVPTFFNESTAAGDSRQLMRFVRHPFVIVAAYRLVEACYGRRTQDLADRAPGASLAPCG